MDSGIPLHSSDSLLSAINTKGMYFLNCADERKANNAFVTGGQLESDDEADMLIFIPFSQPVNLTGFKLLCTDGKSTPKEIYIYKNQSNMDFDDVENRKTTQVIRIPVKKAGAGGTFKLKRTQFCSTNSLTLYIKENYGGTEGVTRINRIEFLGESKEKLDMSKFQAAGNRGKG